MITLAKALKEKNKLKLEIEQLRKRLQTYNSVIKGNPRPFDLALIGTELAEKIGTLVLLKCAINNANRPIQDKIFRMAELKGLAAFYKKLPVLEGKSTERFNSDTNEYEAFFNEAVIAEKIKKISIEIDLVQDELEVFNHATTIQSFD